MALFNFLGKKKQKEEEKKKTIEPSAEEKKQTKPEALTKASVIIPHITEKAAALAEKGIYVFRIKNKTNKITVKKAVKDKYGVEPIRVNIINPPPKKISMRGRSVIKKIPKKAMVFLKEGDKIEIS
jgi:large subunit ribosomal protein L23